MKILGYWNKNKYQLKGWLSQIKTPSTELTFEGEFLWKNVLF